ncbi:hypothetical protein [Devosia sp. 2618]|uniref:hypothetical protein n=1 Tax=Devosia sp. 2618 TaxID=3156454 RepID=UPI0033928845
MNQENTVLEAKIAIDGRTYIASYYVEAGLVHTIIAGKKYIAPLIEITALDAVKSLMQRHYDFQADQSGDDVVWQTKSGPTDGTEESP